YKIINDRSGEFVSDIQDIVWKPILHRQSPGIIYAIQTATTGLFGRASRAGIIPGFHGQSDHFIPLLMEHYSRYRTVHATAHGNQNSSSFTHNRLVLTSAKIQVFFWALPGKGQYEVKYVFEYYSKYSFMRSKKLFS